MKTAFEVPTPTLTLSIETIYDYPGVYAIIHEEEWLYIGFSSNVFRRISNDHHVLGKCIISTDQLLVWLCDNVEHAQWLEKKLIQEKQPRFNKSLKTQNAEHRLYLKELERKPW